MPRACTGRATAVSPKPVGLTVTRMCRVVNLFPRGAKAASGPLRIRITGLWRTNHRGDGAAAYGGATLTTSSAVVRPAARHRAGNAKRFIPSLTPARESRVVRLGVTSFLIAVISMIS